MSWALTLLLKRAIKIGQPRAQEASSVTVRVLKTYTKARTRRVWSVVGRVPDVQSGFELVRRLSSDPRWFGRELAVFVGRQKVEKPLTPAPPAPPAPPSPIVFTVVVETLRECREAIDGLRAISTADQARVLSASALKIAHIERDLMAAFGIVRKDS